MGMYTPATMRLMAEIRGRIPANEKEDKIAGETTIDGRPIKKDYAEVIAAYNNPALTVPMICEQLGISDRQLHRVIYRARKQGKDVIFRRVGVVEDKEHKLSVKEMAIAGWSVEAIAFATGRKPNAIYRTLYAYGGKKQLTGK